MKIDKTTALGVRVYPDVGERIPVIGSYSEVMMHFRLAGQPIEVSLEYDRYMNGRIAVPRRFVAQVWLDGQIYSAPILPCEAGFYCEDYDKGIYYTYADPERLKGEQPNEISARIP